MGWYLSFHEMHLLFAGVSVLLFLARALGVLLDSERLRDERLQVIAVGNDILLVITGLSLWNLMGLNPFVQTWLGAKFLLLCAYVGFGVLALRLRSKEGEAACLFAALLSIGLMVGVVRTRDPFIGLF